MPMTHDKPIDFGLQKFCEGCNTCARVAGRPPEQVYLQGTAEIPVLIVIRAKKLTDTIIL